MIISIKEKALEIVGQERIEKVNSKVYSDFGLLLIDEDILSDNTQLLAGSQSSDIVEARTYFYSVLAELNIKVPEDNCALFYNYSLSLATRVVSLREDPISAVYLMSNVSTLCDHDGLYRDFYFLADAIDSLDTEYSYLSSLENDPEAYVIKFFKYFLCLQKVVPEGHLGNYKLCHNCGVIGSPVSRFKFNLRMPLISKSDGCCNCGNVDLSNCLFNEEKEAFFRSIGYNCD